MAISPKLPFGPKCHELFVILYSILANLSDDMFFVIVYLRQKNEFIQNPEENIILTGPGQYDKILTGSLNIFLPVQKNIANCTNKHIFTCKNILLLIEINTSY
jgi:hypothetical protein